MTDQNSKTALIIGANGLIGSQLLSRLLHSPYYSKVIVLVRKSLQIRNTKLVEVIFDFDKPDVSKVIADDVFCCLGTTIKKAGSQEAFKKVDLEYPVEIGKLARKNGAEKYLIVTAMGADPGSSIFYNRVKGEVEKQLSLLGYPVLHILRPSLLLGDRNEVRAGEKIGEVFAKILKPVMLGALKKYRAIDSSKVAAALLTFARSAEKGIFIHDSGELQQY